MQAMPHLAHPETRQRFVEPNMAQLVKSSKGQSLRKGVADKASASETSASQEWELEAPGGELMPSAPSCGAVSSSLALSPTQAALLHISKSFRYSALLYIEPFAHPTLPSSALNI